MRYVLSLIIYIAATQHTVAEGYRCEDQLFLVEATSPELAERTCHSAAKARAALSTCSVHLKDPVTISVVDAIEELTGSCLGLYHCGDGQVEILSPDAMAAARETDGAFAGISDDALWDSIIVHELTHAAYEGVTCPFSSCVATSEYAAFAMQLRFLPAAELAQFAARDILETQPSRDAISPIMYFMAPDRFAELSWRHFITRPDPCGYMEWIMTGQIFFDREGP